MIVAVIVGARKRSGTKNVKDLDLAKAQRQQDTDRFFLNSCITNLVNRYHNELCILTYACDDGVGKMVKEICLSREIKCGENIWYFHGTRRWDQNESGKCYLARTATMIEIGDLFVVMTDKDRIGLVEDLVQRLQKLRTLEEYGKPTDLQARPYIIIDEDGGTIEEFKKSSIISE